MPKIDEHTELIMRNQSEGGDELLVAQRERRMSGILLLSSLSCSLFSKYCHYSVLSQSPPFPNVNKCVYMLSFPQSVQFSFFVTFLSIF